MKHGLIIFYRTGRSGHFENDDFIRVHMYVNNTLSHPIKVIGVIPLRSFTLCFRWS